MEQKGQNQRLRVFHRVRQVAAPAAKLKYAIEDCFESCHHGIEFRTCLLSKALTYKLTWLRYWRVLSVYLVLNLSTSRHRYTTAWAKSFGGINW